MRTRNVIDIGSSVLRLAATDGLSCISNSLLAVVLLAGTLARSPQCFAYSNYDLNGQGCKHCHSYNGGDARQFNNGLHHSFITSSNCLFCHYQTSGDDPSTSTNGMTGGQGCRGCHGVNNGTNFTWGAGLRLHHRNAGVAADAAGNHCVTCHPNDPVPPPESTLPIYYTRSDVTLKNPCLDNLDNDGNLLKDENDPACSFRITSITQQGNDIRVSWQSVVGRTNYLQVSTGQAGGGFSTNFTEPTPPLIITGTVVAVTNRVDSGGATNRPARYYRIRHQ